jgi:hypothetical protein
LRQAYDYWQDQPGNYRPPARPRTRPKPPTRKAAPHLSKVGVSYTQFDRSDARPSRGTRPEQRSRRSYREVLAPAPQPLFPRSHTPQESFPSSPERRGWHPTLRTTNDGQRSQASPRRSGSPIDYQHQVWPSAIHPPPSHIANTPLPNGGGSTFGLLARPFSYKASTSPILPRVHRWLGPENTSHHYKETYLTTARPLPGGPTRTLSASVGPGSSKDLLDDGGKQ